MATFTDNKVTAASENMCNFVTKYNALIDELQSDVMQRVGMNTLSGFTMRHATGDPDRFLYINFDVAGINFGIQNASGTVISKFTFSALSNLAPDLLTKFGYLADTTLRTLISLGDKEFISKQHLFKELAVVTGVNPSLTFTSSDLLRSYNLVKNLEISATSTTATITIEDDSAGLGQVLTCYVNNNSSSNVAITITHVNNIKYPQNLDSGVSRAGDVVTITANKEYLITFLRTKSDAWSFNILEQN